MKPNKSASESQYAGLHFFNETSTSLQVDIATVQKIITLIENGEQCHFRMIEIIFVDEKAIISINKAYLERDYVTDIITFQYEEGASDGCIEGSLYCCAPRIREQAGDYAQPVETEFRRIIIHGLLHLAGYDDQCKANRKKMREREDFYLQKL